MPKLAAYTFLARYALIILATKMVAGNWLPAEIAHEIAADPTMIEMVAGFMVGASALGWYYWSAARKAVWYFLN